ncbi:hypothetical protein KC19_2G077600 [Ceratodon purpureus]|uniref:TIR domain-containing protein n=1 Tax=Ceratodon purpureus TaxID=3225 RepID=A0A8T0IR98_CERPU|nr:hypothetical protein KC19_2G077600 [Ceratodon purpureus]
MEGFGGLVSVVVVILVLGLSVMFLVQGRRQKLKQPPSSKGRMPIIGQLSNDPMSPSLEDGMESLGPNSRRVREIEPKHHIFLSHSGNEKPFVEQLDHDLRGVNQRPFFDQDSDSLVKGEKFDAQILEVARRCRVAVVVVSEGFLTSEWPMVELSTFVKYGVKLVPLFFKLTPDDLEKSNVEKKWKKKWRKLVKKGDLKEEVLDSWSKAVEELRKSNGVDYAKYANSELKYREYVVGEIDRLWPRRMKYAIDVPEDKIQGYQRLCEVASSMFTEGKVVGRDEESHGYLGLYGMGGVGKTTLCKAMCNYSQGEFSDRVCYVELPSEQVNEDIARKDRLARLKHALGRLGGCNRSVIDSITDKTIQQGWDDLEDGILRNQLPVFLAIDNVGDFEDSRDEARKYLKVRLSPGSKVLVTARSQEILKSVLQTIANPFRGATDYCKPIPRLEWLEAAALFLSYAAPWVLSLSLLTAEEREIVERCVSECRFEDIGYDPSSQYHPLVLRALGTYYHDVDSGSVLGWKEALENRNKLQRSREARNVNDILGLNYDSLSDKEKLVFLDCALYSPGRTGWQRQPWWEHEEVNHMNMWVSWISEVHGESSSYAKWMVEKLQRLSLVEDSSSVVSVHDLYKEFARVLVEKEGSKEWQWWMSQVSNAKHLKRLVLDEDKPIIGRAMGRFVDCRSLVYLELVWCADIGPDLELGNLRSLRVLVMRGSLGIGYNLKRIVCSCINRRHCYERAGGCLSELTTVKLLLLRSLEAVPFLRHCGNLQHLEIHGPIYLAMPGYVATDEEPIDFRYFKALRTISIRGGRDMLGFSIRGGRDMLGLAKCDAFIRWLLTALQLENLTAFEYELKVEKNEEVGVHTIELVQVSRKLSVLSLRLPKQIGEVKGLHLLSELTTLNLSLSKGLRRLPDLRCLPKLKWLCVHRCNNLEALPLLGPEVRGIPDGFTRGHEKYTFGMIHECLRPY